MALLPNRMKKLGAFLAPIGLIVWLLMQFDVFYRLAENSLNDSQGFILNVTIAIVSFFSFLIGLYCLVFSKEKIEDALARDTRLSSFQFAAVIQFLYIILGFVCIVAIYEPESDGMMMFFISAILLFYLVYISRFNFLLHSKFKNEG